MIEHSSCAFRGRYNGPPESLRARLFEVFDRWIMSPRRPGNGRYGGDMTCRGLMKHRSLKPPKSVTQSQHSAKSRDTRVSNRPLGRYGSRPSGTGLSSTSSRLPNTRLLRLPLTLGTVSCCSPSGGSGALPRLSFVSWLHVLGDLSSTSSRAVLQLLSGRLTMRSGMMRLTDGGVSDPYGW